LGSLKGKTTPKTPARVILNTLDDLPDGILEEHANVTPTVDIMYINKIPFIMTLSRAIRFDTIEMIKDERKLTIIKSLQQVINSYHERGFKIQHILVDRQFDFIRKHMETIGINLK